MDDDRFDLLTRQLKVVQLRRATFLGGLAVFSALGLAMNNGEVQAKKRKRKRKKKKPEPTCAELCGFDCIRCFYRADAPPLCGDTAGTDCVSCRSDNDCVGEAHPYCVTRFVLRSTGAITPLCKPEGSCNCAPGALGACTSITACTP